MGDKTSKRDKVLCSLQVKKGADENECWKFWSSKKKFKDENSKILECERCVKQFYIKCLKVFWQTVTLLVTLKSSLVL